MTQITNLNPTNNLFNTIIKTLEGEPIEASDRLFLLNKQKDKSKMTELVYDYIDGLFEKLEAYPTRQNKNLFFDRLKRLGEVKNYDYNFDIVSDGELLTYHFELYKDGEKVREYNFDYQIQQKDFELV